MRHLTGIGRGMYIWLTLIYLLKWEQFLYSIFIILHLNNGFFDVEFHSEHVQVIRSHIDPVLVEKCRDVENEPISENKQGSPPRYHFQAPPCFLKC
jgi:hypothetical protein